MTKSKQQSVVAWLGAVALSAALSACGSGQPSGSAVTGVALADAPVSGTVSLADSSATVQTRSVSTRADGSFSIDVSDLTPPYMLRVQAADATGTRLYAVTEGNDNLDVNPLTDVAFSVSHASGDDDLEFRSAGGEEKRSASGRAGALLAQLKTLLGPLFQRYGITDVRADKAAVRQLLADVRIRREDGVITVTNRATGAVIFQGPLDDLASGTFNAGNMPAGPGTTPPPPATDGAALYAASCQGCHGALSSSSVKGASASEIAGAIAANRGGMGSLASLTSAELAAIASVLAGTTPPPPPPPATCSSFTYSAWGTCVNGTQTRTVLSSSPSGCTGGAPVTSQACTTTPPPPATCTGFTYSTWGTCVNGAQTRTVLSSSPTGCTGGSPVLSQACTAAIDGAALYTQLCAGCHGNGKKGASASAISSAIASNRGGMGSATLRALTAAQIAAISAAP